MSTKRCGKHTTLVSNSTVRITQCTCGQLHVTLSANGVTLQMREEALRGLGAGVGSALEQIDSVPALRTNDIPDVVN